MADNGKILDALARLRIAAAIEYRRHKSKAAAKRLRKIEQEYSKITRLENDEETENQSGGEG